MVGDGILNWLRSKWFENPAEGREDPNPRVESERAVKAPVAELETAAAERNSGESEKGEEGRARGQDEKGLRKPPGG